MKLHLVILILACAMGQLAHAQNGSDITGGTGEVAVRRGDENLDDWLRRNRKDVAPALTHQFIAPIRAVDSQRKSPEDLVRSVGNLAVYSGVRSGPHVKVQDAFNAWSRAIRDFEAASKWVVVYGRQAVPTEGQVSPAYLGRSARATQELITAAYTLADRTSDLLEIDEYRQSPVARERFGQVVSLLQTTVRSLRALYDAQLALSDEIAPRKKTRP